MLAKDAFITALRAENRYLHVEPSTFFRKQTSLIRILNAIEAWHIAKNSINLLKLFREISNIQPSKRFKYNASFRALGLSIGCINIISTAQYNLQINTGNTNGIRIPFEGRNDIFFLADTVVALESINNLVHGSILIHNISNHFLPPRNQYMVIGKSDSNSCAYAGPSPSSIKLSFTSDYTNLAVAMNAMGRRGQWAWLAEQINNSVIYDDYTVAPSDAVISSTRHGDGWINATILESWATGPNFPTPFGINSQQSKDAKTILSMLLYEHTPRGVGISSSVRWNPQKISLSGERARPAFIGLAHELIHAWHNMNGSQPDFELTPLYEYICVGLGPWSNESAPPNLVTENRIRSDINGLQLRLYY